MSSSNFQNESIEKASEMLLTCINEGRIDVLKSILNQLGKYLKSIYVYIINNNILKIIENLIIYFFFYI